MVVSKVLAIHDMSCVGRASLTVVLPIFAACGIEAIPLPTAIFSNHLAFFHVKQVDFTPYMKSFMDTWDKNKTTFDAVYSGYLVSIEQVEIVAEAINRYTHGSSLVVVDPVMGDKGRLYSGITPLLIKGMRELINKADIIKPNYTEACFLCDVSCQDNNIPSPEMIDFLLATLSQKASDIIITSVPAGKGIYQNILLDKKVGHKEIVEFPEIPIRTYGTGDIFSSIITAARLRQVPLFKAVSIATQFLHIAIEETWRTGTNPLEGILFEKQLPLLEKLISQEAACH